MQRLFRKWAADPAEGLSLQNVVNGIARLKGPRDIMNNISYFFDLYDDSGDGKVDREGILRMSEALLFLSRRGFEGTITPSQSTDNLLPGKESLEQEKLSTGERFLGSVSSFIRRCFEYADPTNKGMEEDLTTAEAADKLGSFSIGDDEEDLIDVGEDDLQFRSSTPTPETKTPETSSSEPADALRARSMSQSANPALDPNNPLHITLPTFRMVVLADELLEQFFEAYFPQSFHLSDQAATPLPSLSSNLTTFSNIGAAKPQASAASGATVAGASGGIVPPNRGLRGVLDNIVSDGIRMAAEVKKRMDEAQRELERNALNRDDDEEDDEDDDVGPHGATTPAMVGGISSWGAGAYGADLERRSVRETDRDLLEGAEVVNMRGRDDPSSSLLDDKDPQPGSAQRADSSHNDKVVSKVVEFES
jgi:hypothetical protein